MKTPYLQRSIDNTLDRLLSLAPAVAIDGPKGVGKTETCRRRGEVFSLDLPPQRARALADPRFAQVDGTIVIDEWQHAPQIWNEVRHAVDDGAPPGRFLLTGSATPPPGPALHSGAGRIMRLRMRPMGLFERGLGTDQISLRDIWSGRVSPADVAAMSPCPLDLADYLQEVTLTGLPALRKYAADPDLAGEQVDAYITSIVDHELPESGAAIRRPAALRAWLRAYAAANATTSSFNEIARSAASGDTNPPSQDTIQNYRDHLSRLWLLDPLEAWSPSQNPFTRLQSSPKHYLADPGLAARLLTMTTGKLLRAKNAPQAGHLFESLAVLTLRVIADQLGMNAGHLRTGKGDHEVDLIMEDREGRIMAFEIKLSANVDAADTRHLNWLEEKIPTEDFAGKIIITAGQTAYPLPDGTLVLPLGTLAP